MILQRKSIRLPEYDYAAAGAYFVMVCSNGRRMILAQIEDGVIQLSPIGEVVQKAWDALPSHFPDIGLDEFVIMPNYVHGIVWIGNDEGVSTAQVGVMRAPSVGDASRAKVGATGVAAQLFASPLRPNVRPSGPKRGSLAAIIGSFKSAATREVNRRGLNQEQSLWQRNYYEHVIRDEDDLYTHRRYIHENLLKWQLDEYHA